ncbi:MAG: hypothetical protein HFJ66_05760 [Eggerthellaceae bacterium]|nr:hypothetical protein [Eggerthellaceae bacterium]
MMTLPKRGLAAAAGLTLAVALSTGIGSTFAYFTTYAEAQGGHTITLGERTEITEEFGEWTKHVTIANNAGADGEASRPVFVRARAFAGSGIQLTYSGESWEPNADGWYYCANPVEPGQTAPVLDVKIDNIPEGKDGAQFNVVVTYECTPVLYNADGTPYADWTTILDNGNLSEGGDE